MMASDSNRRPGSLAAGLPLLGDDLRRFAILLDIDGTILDIAPSPGEVLVTDALRDTLRRVASASGGGLAMVSGRPIADIDRVRTAPMLRERRTRSER